MWEIYLLLFIQAVLGIMIFIVIFQVSRLKAQVDEVTKEVKGYISFVIEDGESEKDNTKEQKEQVQMVADEAKNALILSVLGEIFP